MWNNVARSLTACQEKTLGMVEFVRFVENGHIHSQFRRPMTENLSTNIQYHTIREARLKILIQPRNMYFWVFFRDYIIIINHLMNKQSAQNFFGNINNDHDIEDLEMAEYMENTRRMSLNGYSHKLQFIANRFWMTFILTRATQRGLNFHIQR